MCISMTPSRMSNTQLYAGDADLNGAYVHVLAYQNKAMSSGANAMILPVPAKTELGPDNLLDTRDYRWFLDDITLASKNATRGGVMRRGGGDEKSYRSAQVFNVGSYTVVLARAAADVISALDRVPADKRPTFNEAVVKSFEQNYSGHQLAVCCWNGSVDAEPLLLWYEPHYSHRLFAPALDAHDGLPPSLSTMVPTDHSLSFGSTLRPVYAREVRYRGDLPAVARALLPLRVEGTKVQRLMGNGDFVADVGGGRAAFRVTPGVQATQRIELAGWS